MTSRSRLLKFFWWIQFAMPVFAFLVGLETARTARSPDEALGAAFLLMPPLIAAVILAPFVAVRAALSDTLEKKQKVVLILFALSVIAMVIIVAGIIDLLAQQTHTVAWRRVGGSLLMVVLWSGLLLWIKAEHLSAKPGT